MEAFQEAIWQSVQQKNWVAALALALTMPDICGRLETPNVNPGPRYVRWFDAYVSHRYNVAATVWREAHVALAGRDCYNLRCAFLHQGQFDQGRDGLRQTLTRFRFIAPIEGMIVHRNRVNGALQLQVDTFCEDMIHGVADWEHAISGDPDIQERIADLASIEELGPQFTL